MTESFLPVSKLAIEPYYTVIGYPKATKKQINSRISELKKLGIQSVSFQGSLKIGKLSVIGKGYVGIVILAKRKNKLVAIKIRRTDASRTKMNNEAKFLKIANKVGVGPLFIDSSKNFIVMEYLNGEKIATWVNNLKSKKDSKFIKTTIQKILEDCYNLDKVGLDHGELSNITKHVIIDKSKITLIDFESSSTKRIVSNITSATQALCIGTGISKIIKKFYKLPPKTRIIPVLRNYKQEKTRENFEKIMIVLRLK